MIMDSIAEFLRMGGYAAYVWPSYLVAAAVLVGLLVGAIAGLLGASPGASTAASAMVDLLERCFPFRFTKWRSELASVMPSLDGGVPTDARSIETAGTAVPESAFTHADGVLDAEVYESQADSRV